MLYEYSDVRQIKGEGIRRWFADDDFDLIVWYDYSNKIKGFQLCYDKQVSERALTWHKDGNYSHNKIDDGDVTFGNKKTPILVADGLFDKNRIGKLFLESSMDIEKDIADFVYKKIIEY